MSELPSQPRHQAFVNAGEPGGDFALWNSERWAEFIAESHGRVPKRGSAEGDEIWNYLVWKHAKDFDAWISARFPAQPASVLVD